MTENKVAVKCELAEWKDYAIKDIGTVVTGNTPPKKDPENYGGNLIWIKPPDLDKKMFVSSSEETISEIGKNKVRLLPKGSVLVSCIGNIGKIAIADCELCTNQQINSIIPNKDIVDSVFLYYAIKRMKFYLEKIASSAVVPLLNKNDFSKIKIKIPPIETQKKIVEILEKAEKLKEWRAEADELVDGYLKNVFLEMFGDPVKNSKEWDIFKFGDVGKLERGKSKHRPRNAPELLGGSYPLIQTGEVAGSGSYIKTYTQTYSEIGLRQSRMWSKGTLCITIAANIAKTGILTFDACFPDSIVGFTPNNHVKVEYVQQWISFLQKILEDNAPESAQKNINLKILSNLEIPIPPIALQEKFVEISEKLNQLKTHQSQSKKEIDNLFNTLMQKAFKGELVC